MSTLTIPAEPVEVPAPSRSTWGFGHVPALDGLRGAAVAAVLLYHGGYLDGGYLGVDLFFVLSGYLITSLLLAERDTTGRIRLQAFWIRRFRRLMPALLLMLCGVALYAAFIARPIDLPNIRGDGLATLFYVANWHTIRQGTSYWAISLAPSPLQHTWSLAIEEQFYLAWPFVVYAITRVAGSRSARIVGWLSLGLAALSALLFVGLYRSGASLTRIYEGTDTRAVALLLGAAWAAWRVWVIGRFPRWAIESVGLVAGLILGYAWWTLDGTSPLVYRAGLPICSGLALLVVAAACQPSSPVLGRAFAIHPLRWLGLISYGLYLWHWPIYLVLDEQRLGYGGIPLLLTRLAVTIAVALASYYALEQPIRRGRIARGRGGAFMFAGGFAIALVAILVSTRGGVQVGDISRNVGQAKGLVPGAPKVLVVGDSVGLSAVRPIVADPKAYDVNPINGTRIGCSVLVAGHDFKSFAGDESHKPAICYGDETPLMVARRDPDLAVVLLGARPNDYIKVDGEWQRACDPGYDRLYRERVGKWLTELGSSGAQVVLATVLQPGKNAIRVAGDDQRRACVNRLIEGLGTDMRNVSVLDMDELFCPNSKCIEELDGEPVRSDGLHFNDGKGGAAASRLIMNRARKLSGVD